MIINPATTQPALTYVDYLSVIDLRLKWPRGEEGTRQGIGCPK